MIILIGGASHTGKTYLAQKLLESYKVPYLSLDHLKMGLIRGGYPCGFKVTDEDNVIAELLWPIVEGIIRTNIENCQHIIIEGCYLPARQVKSLKEEFPELIVEFYLCFSESYINENFETEILKHRSAIEKRIYTEERSTQEFIDDHNKMRESCQSNGLKYFDIEDAYEARIQDIVSWVDSIISDSFRQ